MKKVSVLKGVFAIAAIAFLSTSAFGKGKLVISKYLDTDYAVVSALSDASSSFKVKVYDDEGYVLYTSPFVSDATSFQKLFDLKSFADGRYKVVFESGDAKVSEVFYVSNRELVLPKAKLAKAEEQANAVKPFVRKDGNNLYVSHINFEKSAFSMSIDDLYGNEIYSSSLPRETSYSGMFDISKLPAGSYSVMLTYGNQKYYYEFNK
nr:hypothetical protein [uncultured Carboxylicivirga sp.]